VINGYIDEVNKIRGTSSSHIDSAGTYTLDGTQAVAYSRIRYTAGGDYKRAERQRTVLFKVFESAKQMNTAAKIKMVSDLIVVKSLLGPLTFPDNALLYSFTVALGV